MSKKFFPELAVGFEDPRVHLHVGDGMFTAIISFTCFIKEFFKLVLLLGLLVFQIGPPWLAIPII